jgi:transcriptional regulator with XRE-family HTH domain
MLYNPWPETLAFLLQRSGLSQAQLASRLGTSGQTVSRWMVQKTRPRPDEFENIARAFGFSPAKLGRIYSRFLAQYYWEHHDRDHPDAHSGLAAGHGGRQTLADRAEGLLRLDLDALPAEMRSVLRAHRNTLRVHVGHFATHAETLISEYEHILEAAGRAAGLPAE